ncbi:hypothetical protein GWK47_005361 [Chionoecetes opilio]|uniref:Uncharacterized protein n=1 Tax=Chionoecetes opilio TaxID=41210 RepID=A0A8J4YHN7_CHIOP|nr:hypothetical protein GWK47_005361 [Chionoecetes opilio]
MKGTLSFIDSDSVQHHTRPVALLNRDARTGQQRWTTTTVRLCLLTRPSKPSKPVVEWACPVVRDPVVVWLYIVYPEEAGSEALVFNQHKDRRWRLERPLNRLGHLEPPGAFGLTNNYGNDPYNGYTLMHKKQVKYVVPPFTPGGRVHVAFQFWIPISIDGFSVTGRDLEAAIKSPNPTAYITSLFLQYLSANTTAAELLGDVEAPVVEAAIRKFLDWVVPHLSHFTGRGINTVNTFTLMNDKKKIHKMRKNKRSSFLNNGMKGREISSLSSSKQDTKSHVVKRGMNHDSDYHSHSLEYLEEKIRRSTSNLLPGLSKIPKKSWAETISLEATPGPNETIKENSTLDAISNLGVRMGGQRSKRQVSDFSDGWVTIGRSRKHDTMNPTAPLMTRPKVWPSYKTGQVQNDRVLWEDDHPAITHNDLSIEADKKPSIDLTSPIDHPASRPRPTSSSSWTSFPSRPTPRPSSSYPMAETTDQQFARSHCTESPTFSPIQCEGSCCSC